ncbi:MAG TPA: hypothetical protein VG498_13085 [Terriglobales bacterium]|nr:hypothetical protein [Terriglobales bacterium]
MNKRPISVTILSLLILAAGAVGLFYHLHDFKPQHPFQNDALWVLALRVLAIVGGVFMLRGSNWARWLTLAWIVFHVGLSFFHSLREVAAHSVLLAVFAYFLLRRPASRYFQGSQPEPA